MIERFKNIFRGLERARGVTYVDKKSADGQKIKGRSFVQREPVTDELWSNHLQGIEPSLGIIPITDENKCQWGCIDVDSYAGFDHLKLINKIKLLKLPLIVFRSKSGGAHIFLFTAVPVEAKLVRDKLLSISAVLGYGGSEIFPKQIELKSKDDTGNFLNLPYFNGDDTTRYAFKEDGTAASLEEFYKIYNNVKQLDVGLIKVERPESEFSDGPPCLESITQSEIKDGRDRIVYQYIQYAKRKWPENWQGKINAFNYKYFNKHPEGPLDDRIIQGKIKFNDGKDLGFKCNEDPMCNHCDKKLCRTRQFGVGGDSVFPVLSDIKKVMLDEPYYWVNVDGDRVKLDSIDYIMEQRLFRRTVAKQTNKKPLRITIKEFEKYTDLLLQGVEEVAAPIGSSKIDQLKNHLEDYCIQRSIGSVVKKDILNGAVYTEDDKHVFIFHRFFHGHLVKKKWKEDYQVTQQMLKEHCGCAEARIYISKKRPSVMMVEAYEKDKPEDKFDKKKLKEEAPF